MLNTEDRKLPKIRIEDLEIGGVYGGKGTQLSVYLGRVDTTILEYKRLDRDYWGSYSVRKKEVKNGMLWFEPYNFEDDSKIQSSFNSALSEGTTYRFKITTSHSVIKKIKKINVPQDFMEQFVPKTVQYAKSAGAQYSNNNPAYVANTYCGCSPVILMRPVGQPCVVPDELKDIMAKAF